MASGLRIKQPKNYRAVLGLRSEGSSVRKPHSQKSVPVVRQQTNMAEDDIDLQMEQEVLGTSPNQFESEEEALNEFEEEDLDTEEILALAEAEEARCEQLQDEVENRRRLEEDQLLHKQQQRREALQRLQAVRSKRVSLETSLSQAPSVVSDISPQKPAKQAVRESLKTKPTGKGKARQPGGLTVTATSTPSAGTSRGVAHAEESSGQEEMVVPAQNQPGESDFSEFSDFARELLYSVKQLKEGNTGVFSEFLMKTLGDNSPSKVCRSESLPNVHFADAPVLGTLELPRDLIPGEKSRNFCVKPELDLGGLELASKPDNATAGAGPSGVGTRSLKSGRTTKPDESGIKKVVQFAHEKLDPVHVKSRVFSDLSFHFLVAGEVELILQEDLPPAERLARLHFLKMLCYHKEYLGIDELRDQYDATLKNIERGTHAWSDYKELETQMHTALMFRATVNAQQGEVVSQQGGSGLKKDGKVDGNKTALGVKVIYCGDYNKKTCPFDNHHQGIFNKKQVTKWHICSKCLAQDPTLKKSHPAVDCKGN